MSFLPSKIIKNKNEVTKEYVERLYDYYISELNTKDFNFGNKFIYHRTAPAIDNKDGGFWHIITKDLLNENGNRVSLPCKADNGFPICIHSCRKFQIYDPFRLNRVYLPNGTIAKPRYICHDRCERISWIKAILKEIFNDPSIFKLWIKKGQGNKIKVHIWYEIENFLIVLEKNTTKNHYTMITSFITNYDSKRRKCRKEYKAFINNNGEPI